MAYHTSIHMHKETNYSRLNYPATCNLTSNSWVMCTCGGSQTLQSLATRDYHLTTQKVNLLRA